MAEEPLTPAVFHVLIALSDGGRHGYGIMQEVAARTGRQTIMGPGTLYGTWKRLLDAGLVEEAGERADPDTGDERGRYYRPTRRGRSTATTEAERLAALLCDERVRRLLKRRRAAQEGA